MGAVSVLAFTETESRLLCGGDNTEEWRQKMMMPFAGDKLPAGIGSSKFYGLGRFTGLWIRLHEQKQRGGQYSRTPQVQTEMYTDFTPIHKYFYKLYKIPVTGGFLLITKITEREHTCLVKQH